MSQSIPDHGQRQESGFHRAPIFVFLFLGASLVLQLSYWPGLMTWDGIEQYQQALDNRYEDWHPPLMAWIWHLLIALTPGTAAMFTLQIALYLGGLALVAGAMWRDGRPRLAGAIMALGLFPVPMVIMGNVSKDALMAGALTFATGLLCWFQGRRSLLARSAIMTLLCLAAALRFNALLAATPLIPSLLPEGSSRRRRAAMALIAMAGFLLIGPLTNHLLRARQTDVALSLVIFDLAGTTEYSGVNLLPDMGLQNVIALNHRCYRPELWDPYNGLDDNLPCPISFDPLRESFRRHHINPYGWWLRAIMAHPGSYLNHRFHHFLYNSRLLAPPIEMEPALAVPAQNPWNFTSPMNPVRQQIYQLALMLGHTPLGWPIFWLGLGCALLVVSSCLPSHSLLQPMLVSALAYGFGYLFLSVASPLRYHLWEFIIIPLAALITAADWAGGSSIPPWRRNLALATVVLTVAACYFTRWLAGAIA